MGKTFKDSKKLKRERMASSKGRQKNIRPAHLEEEPEEDQEMFFDAFDDVEEGSDTQTDE